MSFPYTECSLIRGDSPARRAFLRTSGNEMTASIPRQELSMFRPGAYLIAAVSLMAVIPFPGEVSAQVRRRPGVPAVTPPTPAPSKPADKPADKPGVAGAAAVTQVAKASSTLPPISYGTPQPHTAASRADMGRLLADDTDEKPAPRQMTVQLAGQNVTGRMLHLRGLDAIEKASESDLPEGAKRLLIMHVGKVAAGESDHYIVNPQLAKEWIDAHPVPPEIKPPEKKKESKGCSTRHISMKCVKNEGQQAIDKGSEEWEKLRRQAEDEWKDASGKLSDAWKEAVGCFADKRLTLPDIPVKFSIAPMLTIPLADGPIFKGSSGSGDVKGSVGLGLPMEADFKAQLDLFWIPCLPFVIRPRSLSAEGAMTVGERITANVTATGKFDKTFTIPPTGGPVIPIQIIPIVIAGVPVAEVDISAYIEGSVQVGGEGKAEGNFQLDNPHTAEFDFTCDGGGCTSKKRQVTDALTTSESAQIEGEVYVIPRIYTALQLNFNYNALSARAGPQPYLRATANGCAAVAAQQTAGGPSTVQENHVLAADLDWAVEFRAEALVAGKIVGDPYVTRVTREKHLWFRDLAPGGSTALMALVEGAPQVTSATPATYKVKMPGCYPYDDPVRYQVSWTGGATSSAAAAGPAGSGAPRLAISARGSNPAPSSGSACEWQAGGGTCKVDPDKELVLNLTWPTPGSYTLTVTPIGDSHKNVFREFKPAPKATQLNITVVPAG